MKTWEITTTYYDRKARKEVRKVFGQVKAEDADSAHAEGVRLYGADGARLLGETGEFWAKRAIKVKAL